MGLFSSDDSDDSGTTTFKPVATDGNRVLGYLRSEEGGLEVVWVSDSKFRQLSSDEADEIDRVVE
jgi:hypothetical protein